MLVAQEPVQRVDAMHVRLDDDVAVQVAPKLPLLHLLDHCHGALSKRLLPGELPFQEMSHRLTNLSDLAGLQEVLRLLVRPTVALLEAHGDVQAALRRIRGLHDPAASRDINGHRLFDIDMLAGLDDRFQVLRVQEGRGRDDHRIDFASE